LISFVTQKLINHNYSLLVSLQFCHIGYTEIYLKILKNKFLITAFGECNPLGQITFINRFFFAIQCESVTYQFT